MTSSQNSPSVTRSRYHCGRRDTQPDSSTVREQVMLEEVAQATRRQMGAQ